MPAKPTAIASSEAFSTVTSWWKLNSRAMPAIGLSLPKLGATAFIVRFQPPNAMLEATPAAMNRPPMITTTMRPRVNSPTACSPAICGLAMTLWSKVRPSASRRCE